MRFRLPFTLVRVRKRTPKNTFIFLHKKFPTVFSKCKSIMETIIIMPRRYTDLDVDFIERQDALDELGVADYDEYMKGEIWAHNKSNLLKHPFYQHCQICGRTKGVSLHHLHYRKLDRLDYFPDFIIPVCKGHHHEIHETAKEERCSIEDATKMVFKTLGRDVVPYPYTVHLTFKGYEESLRAFRLKQLQASKAAKLLAEEMEHDTL